MVKLDTPQMMSSVMVLVCRLAGRALARPASTIGRMVVSCILDYEIELFLVEKSRINK